MSLKKKTCIRSGVIYHKIARHNAYAVKEHRFSRLFIHNCIQTLLICLKRFRHLFVA